MRAELDALHTALPHCPWLEIKERRQGAIKLLGLLKALEPRYRSRELQREINSGLNVVESWNSANSVIYYGKTSEIASNRRDEQEMSVLRLLICQAALVYVNVLMIQDVLADPDWDGVLTAEDERGLTPLFWSHVLPYGEVELNMTIRLALGG